MARDTENANLAQTLRRGWAHAIDGPALTVPGEARISYAALDARAAALAGALVEFGVGAGDRVITTAAKSPDSVALWLACLRTGAIHVPLNPAFTAEEIDYFVADAEPALVVTDAEGVTAHAARATLDGRGGGSLADAAAAAQRIDDILHREPGDWAAMLYTSGTTGRPKGAMITHGGLTANGRALNHIWGFAPTDVLLHALPVFHVHGLFVALHCAMLSGAEMRFLRTFDIDVVLGELPDCTVFMGVPTHYVRLLADPRLDRERVSGMRLFTSGSAPMTESVHDQFTDRTGHRILERYGMTEAGIITSNPLHGDRIPGTVGYPLPDMQVRVATDEGPCAPGETGVVEIAGPHLFAGYWGLPDTTADAYRADGWFVTGDVGSLDETGRLTLQGRAGDMIISGGENIYPKEIERCLDAVAGVAESAVIGVPDGDFGEAVMAWLVVDAGPGGDDFELDRVRSELAGRLARFKHPRHYRLIDALPRNTMGKVQKSVLRALADAEAVD